MGYEIDIHMLRISYRLNFCFIVEDVSILHAIDLSLIIL